MKPGIDQEISNRLPEPSVTCPITADVNRKHKLNAGLCHTLEDAGCPLAADVQHRLQFETLLAELSAGFVNARSSDVDSRIEWGLRRIVEMLGLDRSGLGQVSEDRKQLVVTHSYQLPGIPASASFNLDSQFPRYAKMIYQGMVIRLPDDMPPEATQEREYFRQAGLKSNVTIPWMVMGHVVGGIGFSSFRSDRKLPDELIPRLRLVGDIFTNALARKRADEALSAKEQSLRSAKDGLRKLATKLLNAQEEERRRIAREMHDDWTQRLALLGLESAQLEGLLDNGQLALPLLQRIQQQLVVLSDDVHDLSRQLHPAILNDLGLVEALRSECEGFSRRSEVIIEYRPSNVPTVLPDNIALCIYRVAQEALRNVAKHAEAPRALLKLIVSGDELMLQVQDQGAGFDTESERAQLGLGLSSMAERVGLVQGDFSIISSPGQGTIIEVRVPLPERDQ